MTIASHRQTRMKTVNVEQSLSRDPAPGHCKRVSTFVRLPRQQTSIARMFGLVACN